MFPTRPPRTFLLWGNGQKGRNAYTQAFALRQEIDRTLALDAPNRIEKKSTPRVNSVEPKPARPKSQADALGEELLANDSLGG
jgi:hypothetical protein